MTHKRDNAPSQLTLDVWTCESAPEPAPPGALRVAGLFAGIGGFELGLKQAGHETVLLCESDPLARAVLRVHFDAEWSSDVRELPGLPEVDLLVGGFPCQDLSPAGRTAGIAGANSGLVGNVFRLLEVRPVPFVLLENVPFMLQLDGGSAMDFVVTHLEALGYRWAYRVIDTRAFGLPHRRERVFLLASLHMDPRHVLFADQVQPPAVPSWYGRACGFYWTEGRRGLGWAVDAIPALKGGSSVGIPSPPAVLMPDGTVVKPSLADAERFQGFPAGWTDAARSHGKKDFRWRLVGNAVSVPVAKWIGERLASPRGFEIRDVLGFRRDRAWPRAAWNDGTGRKAAEISAWPMRKKAPPLHEFLHEPKPLSQRALRGFVRRLTEGSLRPPEGFLDALLHQLDSAAS